MIAARPDLQEFDDLYDRWFDAVHGKDTHCLRNQFNSIGWKICFYNSIRKRNVWSQIGDRGEFKFCHALDAFINNNFLEATSIALRRAILDANEIDNKKNGVYSVKSILNDVQKHLAKIERKLLLERNKLNFNNSTEEDYTLSVRDFNTVFDDFSEKNETTRSDNDTISESVINKLIERLEKHKILKNKINKYVAHSASPENRDIKELPIGGYLISLENKQIFFDDLLKLFGDGCNIFNAISSLMFYTSREFFPPIGKFFYENIDTPIAPTNRIPEMVKEWDIFIKNNFYSENSIKSIID